MVSYSETWASKISEIEKALSIVGWGITERIPYPLELQIDIEISELPEEIEEELKQSVKRYRDCDYSGAVTSICGAIDLLTENIYFKNNIGDHKSAAYQERISKSFKTKRKEYMDVLKSHGISTPNADLLWSNLSKSISQAGYVLGAYRREFADVHGSKELDSIISQRTLDTAIFIIRNLL